MSNAAEKIDLSSIAAQMTSARIRTHERRRFRRLPIAVGGRMLDQLGREQDCRTADISPGDVRIAAPSLPEVGERVVIYLDGFGRLSGRVARRCGEGEAAIIFEFSAHKREKIAEQLMIAMNKDRFTVAEPAAQRAPPNVARIELNTGDAYEGEIVDFSLTGVTIKTSRTPPTIGAWVRVGTVHGRVARVIEGGFAIDFELPKQR